MQKTPRGYQVNVDDLVESLYKKYPRFNSINAGHILYSDSLKSKVLEQYEFRKLHLNQIYNATLASHYFQNQISVESSIKQFEPGIAKSDFEMASYHVGLNRVKQDLKYAKEQYAKTFVFEALIKLEITKTGRK